MWMRSRLSGAMVVAALFATAGCRQGASGADAPTDQPVWLGNTLGVTNEVPAPWTPLAMQGNTVTYWGGRIEFGSDGLPQQITSQGTDLLSRPVALAVSTTDGPVTFQPQGLITEHSTPASVKLAGAASAPKLKLECTSTVEFDGMVRIDAAIVAQEATRLDSVTLELALPRNAATLFRRFYLYDFDAMKVDRDDLPRAAGATDRGFTIPFCPYVWIGTPEAGLEWFCESDQAFRPWGRPDALTLAPQGDELVFRVRMVTQTQSLRPKERWQITFGLSPTPSRPRIPNWRSYRWGGRMEGPPVEVDTRTHRVFSIFWINEPGGLALEYPGMPWPDDPTAFRAALEDLKSRGILYVPYGALFKIDTSIPEWQRFGTEWSGGRTLAGWKSRRGESSGSSVDIAVPSFQDFLVYTYSEMVREYGICGLYFDFGAPGLNPINPNRPEGRLAEQGIYYAPLFALRSLYQRLYVAIRAHKPDFITIVHGMLPAMCGSFVDVNVQGEGLQDLFNVSGMPAGQAERQLADRKWYVPDYVEALPLDWYVAALARRVSEFPLLIPQITKHNKQYFRRHPDEVTAYTRGMIAIAAVCDVHAIWLTNADTELLQRYSAAKARFGPMNDDVAFYPFWNTPVRIEPASPNVYPTLYTLPDRALLILSNLGNAPAAVSVDLGLAGLGVKPTHGVVTEAMTGAAVPVGGDAKVPITVPAKDFVTILVD